MKKKSKRWLVGFVVLAIAIAAFGLGRARLVAKDSPVDGNRAFADLKTLVSKGPRPAGSPALAEARNYIAGELKKIGLKVHLDEFAAETPKGTVKMVNIRAVRPGRRPDTIAVTGHYDTKLFERESFVGANDGGSSAALVLELARAAERLTLEHTLEFVFFDGEEALVEWTDDDSLYGSRFDVDRRYREGKLRELKAMLLVDMIGDKNLNIRQEASSTGWLKATIWNIAESLGYERHFLQEQISVSDDHIPYLKAGIPAIDIIDLDYPYWHTPGDTLDKVSAESLKIVGDVVYFSVIEIDRRLRRD